MKSIRFSGNDDQLPQQRKSFSMQEYISKLLDESPNNMDGIVKTPAANHLFNINQNRKKITEEKAQLFHHVVAKL